MVLMGEGREGAQETSLSPMGCRGGGMFRVHTFMDYTRKNWQGLGWGYSVQGNVAKGYLANLRKKR